MTGPPRKTTERMLTLRRLLRIGGYGFIMMTGTLGVMWWGSQNGSMLHAQTLAFTTFVLFQVFNVFNVRAEEGSAFNANFFRNRVLWLALTSVVLLQVVTVQWTPIKGLFDIEQLSITDWLFAASIASSILLFEEMRKYLFRVFRR